MGKWQKWKDAMSFSSTSPQELAKKWQAVPTTKTRNEPEPKKDVQNDLEKQLQQYAYPEHSTANELARRQAELLRQRAQGPLPGNTIPYLSTSQLEEQVKELKAMSRNLGLGGTQHLGATPFKTKEKTVKDVVEEEIAKLRGQF